MIITCCNVYRAADGGGLVTGGHGGLHDVGYVGEIARVMAISINCGPLAVEHQLNELWDHGCVAGAGVLSFPENIEIAESYRFDSVCSSRHERVLLRCELGDRV